VFDSLIGRHLEVCGTTRCVCLKSKHRNILQRRPFFLKKKKKKRASVLRSWTAVEETGWRTVQILRPSEGFIKYLLEDFPLETPNIVATLTNSLKLQNGVTRRNTSPSSQRTKGPTITNHTKKERRNEKDSKRCKYRMRRTRTTTEGKT
jgi:hypothetical protein